MLARKQYKLPKAARLIVNSPKKNKSETEYTVEDSAIVKIDRVWDEFQVATIEPESDGKFGLYYNIMLYYHKGPRTVPTGKWVLGPRFRSSPIAAKHAKPQ